MAIQVPYNNNGIFSTILPPKEDPDRPLHRRRDANRSLLELRAMEAITAEQYKSLYNQVKSPDLEALTLAELAITQIFKDNE